MLQWGHGVLAVEIRWVDGFKNLEHGQLQGGHGVLAVEICRIGRLLAGVDTRFNGATAC